MGHHGGKRQWWRGSLQCGVREPQTSGGEPVKKRKMTEAQKYAMLIGRAKKGRLKKQVSEIFSELESLPGIDISDEADWGWPDGKGVKVYSFADQSILSSGGEAFRDDVAFEECAGSR
jgi:hypothetical protein